MKDDNRILLDLTNVNKDIGFVYELDFTLTEEELKSFPSVVSFEELVVEESLVSADYYYVVNLRVYGSVTLLDSHDPKKTLPYEFDDDMDITVAIEDLDNSDILPDKDGEFDLRGSILALLFDAIPLSYSETELTKIVTEEYTLMSEAEKRKESHFATPFSHLDDIEDKED